MSRFSALLLCSVLVGCSTPKDSDEDQDEWGDEYDTATMFDGDDDGDADGEADQGSGDLTADDMPEEPAAFTLTPADGSALIFNQPTCQHFRGSTNFRMFWRDSLRSHTYVLTIEVMNIFEGAGIFTQEDGMVRVRLQEEAPRTGAPSYWTDSSQGHTTEVRVDYIDENVAWGEAVISSLQNIDTDSTVDVDPNALPIWCPDVEI